MIQTVVLDGHAAQIAKNVIVLGKALVEGPVIADVTPDIPILGDAGVIAPIVANITPEIPILGDAKMIHDPVAQVAEIILIFVHAIMRNGISTDIIGASIRAYLSALNKIVYEEA